MDKTTNCLNCGHTVHDNFCAHCGQSARTERINLSLPAEEFQHYFLHMHKGLLYPLGALLLRPGSMIREYTARHADRGSGYNYLEHLTLYAYITGTEIFILLGLYPLFYFTRSASVYITGNTILLLYNVLVLAILFQTTSRIRVVVKALLSILLT